MSTRILKFFLVETDGSYSKLVEARAHKLERNAYNLTSGFFGKETGVEQVCV